ncbi:hypothetical protein GY31_03325 [Lysinibacillus sphaericus]|uniref:hypothetical protein n=1 Tax=Lysinibacillus TaxID=400634 RepID=UPI00084AD765|nr:hypothetical protein [Lysinibacillus sphaericus]OEC03150.1 hypothetical protein GY31_03325 [Lysinibacillus sphaericus]
MAYKKRSKNLEVARNLPPSYHTLPGEVFDIRNSEVINWLIKQPEILNYLWNNIKNSDDVEYNPATGVWTGVEYNVD